jgi:hypothetical protein
VWCLRHEEYIVLRRKLISFLVKCECGARCSVRVREELLVEKLDEDKHLHPWRYWHKDENVGIPI